MVLQVVWLNVNVHVPALPVIVSSTQGGPKPGGGAYVHVIAAKVVGFAPQLKLTVSVVFPLMASKVALIRVVPVATPVASPAVSMVAVAGVSESQTTELVMSNVDESE